MKQLFIGLDVHKKTWTITIQEEHLILKRFTIGADSDLLIGDVAGISDGFQQSGLQLDFIKHHLTISRIHIISRALAEI
jgi:hypothetical protein